MDIWFIDVENVGCFLLNRLPVDYNQHNRFMVFSRSSNARKWCSRYPLHAQLFNDYDVGKNQADFYMVSVLTQVLMTEPDPTKRIILLTKDQELIQAFKSLCDRHQVVLTLLVCLELPQLPDPKIAIEAGVKALNFSDSSQQVQQTTTLKNTPLPAIKQSTKISAEQINEWQEEVKKALKKQPITIKELARLLKITFREIQEVTNPLIKNGTLIRVSKTGKKWRLAQTKD